MMKIVEVLGVPPIHMLATAPKTPNFFEQLSDGSYIVKIKDRKPVNIVLYQLCIFKIYIIIIIDELENFVLLNYFNIFPSVLEKIVIGALFLLSCGIVLHNFSCFLHAFSVS